GTPQRANEQQAPNSRASHANLPRFQTRSTQWSNAPDARGRDENEYSMGIRAGIGVASFLQGRIGQDNPSRSSAPVRNRNRSFFRPRVGRRDNRSGADRPVNRLSLRGRIRGGVPISHAPQCRARPIRMAILSASNRAASHTPRAIAAPPFRRPAPPRR